MKIIFISIVLLLLTSCGGGSKLPDPDMKLPSSPPNPDLMNPSSPPTK